MTLAKDVVNAPVACPELGADEHAVVELEPPEMVLDRLEVAAIEFCGEHL
jgi:hypothetical protein